MSLAIGSQTEPTHSYEHLAGPIDENQSNEALTVLSGQNLVAGAVLGRVRFGVGGAVVAGPVAGNGTLTNFRAGPKIEVGDYVLACITTAAHGGTFSVTTPSGRRLPNLVLTAGAGVATNYESDHFSCTVTDGSSDFTTSSVFTVTVSTTAPLVQGGTGTGTVSALSLGPLAKPGNYRFIIREAITNGGRGELIGPDGDSLGDNFTLTAGSGTATAFSTPQLRWTVTDATDFIVGNAFDIVVFNLAGGKAVAWDPSPASYDGRHVVAGVLKDAVDASSGDLPGVATVRGPVTLVAAKLGWLSGMLAEEQALGIAQLKALGLPAI